MATSSEHSPLASSDHTLDSKNKFGPGLSWLTAVTFVLATTAIFTIAVEWQHYRTVFAHLSVDLERSDRLILLWMLWWKTLILLVPILIVYGLCCWWRLRRIGWSLLMIGWVAIIAWLAIDLRVQQAVGAHAFDFLPNLYDAVMMPMEANHTEWGGDSSGIYWGAVLIVSIVVITGLAAWRIARSVSLRWLGRCYGIRGTRGWAWTATFTCVPLLAFLPAQASFGDRMLLRQAKTVLPVDLGFVDSKYAHVANWLGIDSSDTARERGVRIISLLPNPAGFDAGKEQVHLHNFSDKAVDLDRWTLKDKAGNRLELSGSLPALSTRIIALQEEELPLNNKGDVIVLYDTSGAEVHRVAYGSKEAKYGALLSFREPGDYDAFETQLNTKAQITFGSMFDELRNPPEIDRNVKLPEGRHPNVIYIVLESFRASAVSPEVMSQLYEWGGHGLRCQQHYAGSNSSHYGLFTLLYSRSPLTYHASLDKQLAPQTPFTLRASGYENYFITSGDCRGFRRMDEFLNEDYFDEVIIENGKNWRDWTDRDRRSLKRVKELATGRGDKPRFIMAFLMSTHFPYAFPPEFNEFQPSGDGVSRGNWRKADPQVLHNRYRNSARYLESRIMDVIQSLDPEHNIIVVTGDHGESMFEDGALAHATRGSEVQTRVPFLMVGPGVPAGDVALPTMHTDALPTLLHALAGNSVEVKRAHGRDLLSGAPLEDQVLICPYRWKDPFDLVLKRGSQRLQFKYRLDRSEINVFGFCDESANLDLNSNADVSPRAADEWADAFRRELQRVVR